MSKQKIKTKIQIGNPSSYTKQLAWGLGSISSYFLKEIPGSRDKLPEPFDIPDHSGNVSVSLTVGYVTGLATGMIYGRFAETSEPKEAVRRTRTVMALAGFVVGLAINSVTETKFGLRTIPDAYGTPDAIDLVYGVAASTAAAGAAPSVEVVRDFSNSTQDLLDENLALRSGSGGSPEIHYENYESGK